MKSCECGSGVLEISPAGILEPCHGITEVSFGLSALRKHDCVSLIFFHTSLHSSVDGFCLNVKMERVQDTAVERGLCHVHGIVVGVWHTTDLADASHTPMSGEPPLSETQVVNHATAGTGTCDQSDLFVVETNPAQHV